MVRDRQHRYPHERSDNDEVLSMSSLSGTGAVAQLVYDGPLQFVEVTCTNTYPCVIS
ncbi:hypothetical protein Hanom_Chr07g00612471 [Helianthus anomalus]